MLWLTGVYNPDSKEVYKQFKPKYDWIQYKDNIFNA